LFPGFPDAHAWFAGSFNSLRPVAACCLGQEVPGSDPGAVQLTARERNLSLADVAARIVEQQPLLDAPRTCPATR
jgi:hypothetical protein